MPVTTNTVTSYVTSDGRSFTSRYAAEQHEANSVTAKKQRAQRAKDDAKAALKAALQGMQKGEYQYIPPEVITMVTNISFEHPRTVAKYLLQYVRATENIGVKADGGKVSKTFRA